MALPLGVLCPEGYTVTKDGFGCGEFSDYTRRLTLGTENAQYVIRFDGPYVLARPVVEIL